ncbi:zinc carboxypeptidase [Melghiribacillus thermohalophilus]|uniref:Zinc carboxypeptidase n=1 Tax=Melghiribacillus thermohalophilus TaxID=1324956 RepID=A0A4R3MWH7_9BACI|nr:M14 family metallocarboxypeptidase [Melghiribacillus thermohalophilus]TCT19876.1 zinc carboxypeptidase [Melghiribacillus thermohalophilus]
MYFYFALNIYTRPSKSSSVLKSYDEGDKLLYQTFSDNWYEALVYVNGKPVTGYIYNGDVINQGTKQKDYTGFAVKDKTYVYEETSKHSKKLKGYTYGAKMLFKSYTSNWYEAIVYLNGKPHTGYIHKNDVSFHRPYSKQIVNPKMIYTYEQMVRDIKALENTYPGIIQTEIIGKSVDGRNIYAVKLGKGDTKISINAATHAREWITTNLVMHQIDTYSRAYTGNKNIDGYNVRDLLNKVSIYYVPMVNPDGVTLVQKGPFALGNPYNLIRINGGKTDFSHWKANANGVDLNRNYPVGWRNVVNDPGKPSSQNFKGYTPLSEPETIALSNFSLEHDFKTIVSYHSSGEVIYWENGEGEIRENARKVAHLISKKTGYSMLPASFSPGGGFYADWFTENTGQPSVTPEVSPYVGSKPVPISNYDRIWKQNFSIGLVVAYEAYQSRHKR